MKRCILILVLTACAAGAHHKNSIFGKTSRPVKKTTTEVPPPQQNSNAQPSVKK